MKKILHKELSFSVIGAAKEVHSIPGPGYLENVYQTALAHELRLRSISFCEHQKLCVNYKSLEVGNYEADFVIDEKIILELKSVSEIISRHEVQTLNYLTATGLKLGIILNFGNNRLQYKRIVK